MILRPWAETDIDSIYDIERATNQFPWSLQQLLTSFQGSDQCSLISIGKVIVGYAISCVVLNEVTLLNIVIAPSFQGRGYGKKLLVSVLESLEEYQLEFCYLEVRKSNINAVSLYHSLGFEQVGVRKNYYPAIDGREDARVMCKQLPVYPLEKTK